MSITLFALLFVQDAAAPAPTPPPPACAGEAHAAFDFWVGEWEVSPNSEGAPAVANSRIEKVAVGCAVRETWMPFRGPHGASLNGIGADGLWHQRWVGGGNTMVDFRGGPTEDGRMVLTGNWKGAAGPDSNPLIRMTYTLREDGSVRQHGEQSVDHGLTWSDSFDLIYRPKQ